MMRFGELVREACISPGILLKELYELDINQLVRSHVCDAKPVTVEYTATDYAQPLKDLLDALKRWGTGT